MRVIFLEMERRKREAQKQARKRKAQGKLLLSEGGPYRAPTAQCAMCRLQQCDEFGLRTQFCICPDPVSPEN